jgi:hypothetical protein
MNKDINIEILKNVTNRLFDFSRKHSNLDFSITEHYNIRVYHKTNWSSNIIFKGYLNNIQTIDGSAYSFLMNHNNDDTSFMYCYCSIFKYAELCRNHYMIHRPIRVNTISYEICHSESGQVIKSLGFPTSLEELAIKMDLLGI